MTRQGALDLGREALVWLAGRPDAMARFLGESGLDPSDLRTRASDPETLGSILDFLLADERLLMAFSGDSGLDPAAAGRARALLPGGDLPHWT